MDQVKIGRFIAECRKNKKMTQAELAEKLNVTDKSVSKWECGTCLPNVSLYKDLCEILDITLNDLFAGEKIEEEKFKEVAEKNLMDSLENSTFSLKEKIEFYKQKWQKEHIVSLIIVMIIIASIIIFGFIKHNGVLVTTGIILGFMSGIVEYNIMMAYIEKHAYGQVKNSLKE